ncbi:hypothetical protein NMY22_g2281 [Coprinellus aureogranulatus]|nr:hypothetical protein NMY22_g2281 [Coprinellus aureogranulatus]
MNLSTAEFTELHPRVDFTLLPVRSGKISPRLSLTAAADWLFNYSGSRKKPVTHTATRPQQSSLPYRKVGEPDNRGGEALQAALGQGCAVRGVGRKSGTGLSDVTQNWKTASKNMDLLTVKMSKRSDLWGKCVLQQRLSATSFSRMDIAPPLALSLGVSLSEPVGPCFSQSPAWFLVALFTPPCSLCRGILGITLEYSEKSD